MLGYLSYKEEVCLNLEGELLGDLFKVNLGFFLDKLKYYDLVFYFV